MLSPKHRKGRWVLFGTPEQLSSLIPYKVKANAVRIVDGQFAGHGSLVGAQSIQDLKQFYMGHYPYWIQDDFSNSSIEEYI